jgi:hypothetical protein
VKLEVVGFLFCTNNHLDFPSFTLPFHLSFLLLNIFPMVDCVCLVMLKYLNAFFYGYLLPVWFANIINWL